MEGDDRVPQPLVSPKTRTRLGWALLGLGVGVVLGIVLVVGVRIAWDRLWGEDDYVDVRTIRISGRVVQPEDGLTCVEVVGADPVDSHPTGGSSDGTICAAATGSFAPGTEVLGVFGSWCEPHLACDAAWLTLNEGEADFLPPPRRNGGGLD